MNAGIAALHRRGKTRVGIRLVGQMSHLVFEDGLSKTPDEAIVRGWTRGVQAALDQGASSLTIVVTRKLLTAFLRQEAQVRSLAVLAAFRAFAVVTSGVPVRFEYRETGVTISSRSGVGAPGATSH